MLRLSWPKRFKPLLIALLCFVTAPSMALEVSPPSWWVGMQEPSVELMVHGEGVANASVAIDSQQISLTNIASQDSDNYLFVELTAAANAPAQTVELTFTFTDGTNTTISYEFEQRDAASANRQGFSAKDAIYLITPDRFANGDLDNDLVSGYSDLPNRDDKGGRHGGDIAGIIKHLDYIAEMGFTQIWTMPLLENAMPSYSYHGYSTTDYFKIDPRYGSNELYRELSMKASERGIGVIMDVILNHIGSEHTWMKDMPSSDWINNDGHFTPTSHRRESLHDPHGVDSDITAFNQGWFVPTMPDLNQQNPHMATYLIQHAIWWVEYAHLSGIRVDTYSYSDKHFLTRWTQRVMQEYPNLNIVGEEWSTNPLITSYWQRGTKRADNYESELPSVMDFPLQTQMIGALNNDETWATGLRQLYEVLASDFIYGDPYNLVIFGDNHDMSRVYTQVGESYARWNQAMTLIATLRGIPQVFYGTEILMGNAGTDDHGVIRSDFPGGWPGDPINAFLGNGLSSEQSKAQQRVKSLFQMRKNSRAITQGVMTHYGPENGVYVYFRHLELDEPLTKLGDRVMVVINKNEVATKLNMSRFEAMFNGVETMQRLADGSQHSAKESLMLAPQSATVWLLQ